NPADIEELVTNKIEYKIKNLEDLKLYNSSSGQGFSSVFVEFDAEADLEESFRKLREAADEAEPNLPDSAENPVVTEINFNDFPIVTYSLVGDYDEIELKKYADIIKDEFESIPDVSKASIIGGLEREFQVIANQTKLASFNISMGQIIGAISSSNFSLPAGNIEIDGFKYGVRVKGKVSQATELNDIVIATYDNTPIFLRDIALIKDGFKDKDSESMIGFPKEESKKTISIQIFKKTGGNILNIVEVSQEKIDELTGNKKLPENLRIQKTNDNSTFIKEDLKTLGTSGLLTVILITIILLMVLSFRGALITAMSVPLDFLMAFIFLKIQGMTLNSMVLFSLVLSLGLMVDNAIVIIEGINEYVEHHKKSIYESALLSVWNFKWAITAGTMTTVGAFLPMLLVSGILGEYMSILPKTIAVTLISSLFVAIVVIPVLATRFIKIKNSGEHRHRNKKRHAVISNFFTYTQKHYIDFMRSTLPYKKKRRMIIATGWILFIIAVIIPASGLMKIEMFPKIDLDYFYVNIELSVGSTFDETRPITKEAEKLIAQIPELDNYVTSLGGGATLGFGASGGSGTYLANIIVNLVDKDLRERTSYEIAEDIRGQAQSVQGAKVTIEELEAGPPSGAPIEVRLFGDDLSELSNITKISLITLNRLKALLM
ncbi:efflux RND transporter permease subunit, partial [bacterium]|nr:efflux RND transporter permease subunit [bacterium]